jgi:hypothetical protein
MLGDIAAALLLLLLLLRAKQGQDVYFIYSVYILIIYTPNYALSLHFRSG